MKGGSPVDLRGESSVRLATAARAGGWPAMRWRPFMAASTASPVAGYRRPARTSTTRPTTVAAIPPRSTARRSRSDGLLEMLAAAGKRHSAPAVPHVLLAHCDRPRRPSRPRSPSWRIASLRRPAVGPLSASLSAAGQLTPGARRGRLSGKAATRECRGRPLVPSSASADSRSRQASPRPKCLQEGCKHSVLGLATSGLRPDWRPARSSPKPGLTR